MAVTKILARNARTYYSQIRATSDRLCRKHGLFTEEGIRATIEGNLTAIEAGLRPATVRHPTYRPYKKHPKYTVYWRCTSIIYTCWVRRANEGTRPGPRPSSARR